MFLAGQTSVLGRRWLWCGSGAGIAAAIAAVIFIAGVSAKPEAAVRVVYVPISSAPTVSAPERATATDAALPSSAVAMSWNSGGEGYLRLQRQVLRAEFEALPSLPPTTDEPPLTQQVLRRSALSPPDRPGRSLLDGF
jgi:hypothetical protein